MIYATADARDGQYKAECNKCCCEQLAMRPGETNLVVLNYAPWAIPLGGHGMGCTPQFSVEQITACPAPTGDNLPPTATIPIVFAAPTGEMAGTLTTKITDPEGDPLTFEFLPIFGPNAGSVTLGANFATTGAFDYKASSLFNGYDRFFVTADDGNNKPVMFEIIIAVGTATEEDAKSTPGVRVPANRVVVNQQLYTLALPIEVSPAAKPCDVYRLTVRQNAYDCNYNCFWHVSCYDIAIKPC